MEKQEESLPVEISFTPSLFTPSICFHSPNKKKFPPGDAPSPIRVTEELPGYTKWADIARYASVSIQDICLSMTRLAVPLAPTGPLAKTFFVRTRLFATTKKHKNIVNVSLLPKC